MGGTLPERLVQGAIRSRLESFKKSVKMIGVIGA